MSISQYINFLMRCQWTSPDFIHLSTVGLFEKKNRDFNPWSMGNPALHLVIYVAKPQKFKTIIIIFATESILWPLVISHFAREK